jgi:hypothetical protein
MIYAGLLRGTHVSNKIGIAIAMICVAAALVQGCSRVKPIYNVDNHPIPQQAQRLSLDEIRSNIEIAGSSRGWRFIPIAPGQLRGTYQDGKHTAVVDVHFTQQSYSIFLNSSQNLQQSAEGIHRNYDNWIHNLERDIEGRLYSAGAQQR